MAKMKQHEWIAGRDMLEPALVLRIDDYGMEPLSRGQFVPPKRYDDNTKAIWPTVERAKEAAEWAVKQFGHQYAVFQMVAIVEHSTPPVQVTDV